MYNVIGKKVQRVDAYEKVTGKAIYGDDIKLHGLLYAAVRHTDIPVGKITKIDCSKAKMIPGVKAVALYKDIPGQKRLGPIRADQYAIVKDEVFYSGDVIAVVAAESKEIAYKAVDLIRVEYEQIDGIFDPREAIKPTSRLIHPEFKSNIVVHYPLRKGNVQKSFEQSDHIIEREYKTGFVEHSYIEPESITAVPDPISRGFKIYGSIQNPYTTRKIVSLFMGLNMNQVNVMSSTLGGSFGGKDDVINYMACRCALLSKMTGKPVKLTYTREDSIKESYKRHPYYMKYKVGFNKNGKINAMKINIIADSGAYSSQTFFVNWRSVVQATGPYEIENVETDIKGVYTNNTYTAAFRGFGSPQVIFAQESLMDEIAEICKISPVEIRKINGFKQGSITASGQTLNEHKVSLAEVIDKAVKRSNYNKKINEYQKFNKENIRFKYGIGLSCSFRGCSLGAEGTDATSAIVSVQADGSVYVIAGLNENGQGMKTTFSQITAEVFGINLNKIVFLEPQTATVTDGGPTVASRATLTGGNAIKDAAEQVKSNIFNVIKDELQVSKINETIWEKGFISRKKDKRDIKPINFEEAAEKTYLAGVNLSAYGWFKAPHVDWDEKTGQGTAYFTYVYGCHIAEIKIDTSTGKIDVLKVTAAHDVGRVINKLGAEGQVYGGVTQGIGYAILEDYNIQNGVVKSTNFDEYLIPTVKDINKIEPIFIENPDKYGPYGAKSLGEPTLELTSAAINNALKFATGKHSYEIPLTLEKVYLGKNLKKPSRQSHIAIDESFHIHEIKKQTPRITNVKTYTPRNLMDSLEFLSKDKFEILAGGTDIIIGLRMKTGSHKLLNINPLQELKKISITNKEITIGSAVTFSRILENQHIRKNFPLLTQACRLIGSKQIRNRGTMGGNIVNAAPCADSYPPLIIYEAKFILKSKKGKREISAKDFIIKNYKTQIKPDEILTEIIVPIPRKKKYFTSYFKLGRRNAMNITRMSVGIQIAFDKKDLIEECKIVSGSLFNQPKRITKIENILIGKNLDDSSIIDIEEPLRQIINDAIGTRWSAEYKLPVFINICKDALRKINHEFTKKNLENGYPQKSSFK